LPQRAKAGASVLIQKMYQGVYRGWLLLSMHDDTAIRIMMAGHLLLIHLLHMNWITSLLMMAGHLIHHLPSRMILAFPLRTARETLSMTAGQLIHRLSCRMMLSFPLTTARETIPGRSCFSAPLIGWKQVMGALASKAKA
jgi:hypothetical protein